MKKMKKLQKFNIFVLLSCLVFLCNPIQSLAADLYIDETSEYFQELLKDTSYNETYQRYLEQINTYNTMLNEGTISQEEFEAEKDRVTTETNELLQAMEQDYLSKKDSEQDNVEVVKNDGVFSDTTVQFDENGEIIKDYTNVDFSNMENKRTVTFKPVIQDKTAPTSGLYIKFYLYAQNLEYETSVLLDESNDYTATVEVPNDRYLIAFEQSNSPDFVKYESGVIDVRDNPEETFYIRGGTQIDSNEGEVVQIEGEDFVEEKKETINYKLIFIIAGIVILVSAIGAGTYFAIKIKKENEI